ncbi:hypothetical protein [Mycolicibacterium houstonense]|uniref:hypothetical protein n=1 Tax=Mycolicibacterium houstonense TaxID=146021 RepID=UPI0008364192|nr:hypothetical protein [Mycolicibacterium houstonense]
MRRVMFAGARDWGNWFAIQRALKEEQAEGPFVAVHQGSQETSYHYGAVFGTGEPTKIRMGCTDAYVEEYCREAGIPTAVAEFDPTAVRLRAFPSLGDEGVISVMAQALAAGIEVVNHGWQPAIAAARRQARELV